MSIDFPAGWKVHPCHPNSKKPILDDWPTLATDDPEQIEAWAEEYPGCNWALACGPSNITVIDIDPPTGEDSLFAFELENGFLPETREHRSARGGRHLIFEGDCPNSVAKLGPKLDTRGRNGYIVIPPSTFEDQPYEVIHDCPIAALPDFIAPAVSRAREHAKAAEGIHLDDSFAVSRATTLLRGYVVSKHVAVEGSGGDALTYAVAAEVLNLGLSTDKAFDLIDTIWNVACVPPWDADELRVKIENASQYSQNDTGAWAVPPVTERITSEALDKLIADNASQPAPAQGERSRFAWMDEAEFMNMAPPEWLLPEIFTTESIAMLYGPSGHYKSFLALNLAASVAQQDKLAFYVAAEGLNRMARYDYPAWKLAYAEERRLPFYMVEDMPIVSEDGADYDAFADSITKIAKAEGKPVGIIFLDTLNNAMLGLEENSATDAAKMIAACKALKRTFKCTVVVVHHTPADGKDPRGSTAFYAGFDTVLKVIANKAVKLATMFVKKQKTAEEREHPFCFEGKRIGTGLAFTPIDNRQAMLMSDDADIYNAKSISRALVGLKAFEPNHVSTHVLAGAITPQIQNETIEQRNDSVARVQKALTAAAKKGGKLDGYYQGVGAGMKWSLPAPVDH